MGRHRSCATVLWRSDRRRRMGPWSSERIPTGQQAKNKFRFIVQPGTVTCLNVSGLVFPFPLNQGVVVIDDDTGEMISGPHDPILLRVLGGCP